MEFIGYNKTMQFANVVKQICDIADYNSISRPTITFEGTVKLHGTNAAVVFDREGNHQIQSRQKIITPEQDNAGFARFIESSDGALEHLRLIADKVFQMHPDADPAATVQIYGEWAGQGIQKGVGIGLVPKMFYIFRIRISTNNEQMHWVDLTLLDNFTRKHPSIRSIRDFGVYKRVVDFNYPGLSTFEFAQTTLAVEARCPVAHQMTQELNIEVPEGEKLVGEGVVWVAVNDGLADAIFFKHGGLHFKVKGEEHTTSKVKTLAASDPEKVKSVVEFIEYAVTENRLKQGLQVMQERNVKFDRTGTGDYIRWVVNDVLSEEYDTMRASLLEEADVNREVTIQAKNFWFKTISAGEFN